MNKIYNITGVLFETEFIIISLDNRDFRIRISDVSEKLAKASDFERSNFTISPSGYGIHWNLIDEDISINGILHLINKHAA